MAFLLWKRKADEELLWLHIDGVTKNGDQKEAIAMSFVQQWQLAIKKELRIIGF